MRAVSTPRPLSPPDYEELAKFLETHPSAAIERLRPYAERGEPHLQLLLGQLLINGVGALCDPHEALRWFRAAARARVPMAMNMVGRCHEYGLGTPPDYARAAHWYHRAATFDCDWAIYNYAHLLASGRGVKQDRAAAFLWFKLAASRGHARAMAWLGQYYENGWETPADRDAAIRLYQRSAEAGDYRGRCNYAFALTQDGRIEEALSWLRLAATNAPPHTLRELADAVRRSPHEVLHGFADTLVESAARSAPGMP